MLTHADILARSRRQAAHEPLPPDRIERILRFGAPVGCVLEHHHRLDRCMDRLRHWVLDTNNHPPTGLVVRAGELAASRGRFQRSWFAPRGGLHLALLWADTLLERFSRFLPLAVGLACCEAVRSLGVTATLKWVNDVLVRGRKICGVLCDTLIHDQQRYHLIGIGINVNIDGFPDDLSKQATSVRLEIGADTDLDRVAEMVLSRLQWNLGLVYEMEHQWFERDEGLDGKEDSALLLDRWLALSDMVGRRVVYGFDVQRSPLFQGVVRGLDPQGGLMIEMDDGSLVTEYSGEILYLERSNSPVQMSDG